MNSYYSRTNVQLLTYLLSKVGKFLSVEEMSALVFLADRYHLRKYGRTISHSRYYAYDFGPCPIDTIEVYLRMLPQKIICK